MGNFLYSYNESCGNSSEFRLVKVGAVQAILEGDEINLGRIIENDLWKIANEENNAFILGHCSLIQFICNKTRVDVVRNDMVLKKGQT